MNSPEKLPAGQKILSLAKESWAVSWPMTIIMFFMFLIGLADVYVAGRINTEIQAAYGVSSQLYFIFSIIAFALTVGTVSLTSQLYTSGREKDFIDSVDSSLTVAMLSGIVFSVIGFALARPIIQSMHIPYILKEKAVVLLRIYSTGLVFTYILTCTNGILRASGRIWKSLFTMAVVCILNTVLNFTLAFKTPLGFMGIGIATVISVSAGCVLNLLFMRPFVTALFQFSPAAVRKIIGIGWPAGLLQIFWQLGAMVLYLILAALPANAIETMAAFTNGIKIESAIFLPAFAFNMANAVLIGNLLGKKNYRDAFSTGIVTAFSGVFIVLILTLLVMLNARAIASLLSNNQVVIEECARYIRIALLFEPIMAWAVILGGALNGAGDTKTVMLVVAFCIWIVRVPISYLFALKFGLGAAAVWWAMNFSLLAQSILISRRYFSKRWIFKALT